ncbi:MAG: right-handed parallel beta-helix repeat-containing protein [Thermoplasmata archaeon]|nr:right-handed parallel beta-helix repeat-containing protein [Thermoplasmata archaeon]
MMPGTRRGEDAQAFPAVTLLLLPAILLLGLVLLLPTASAAVIVVDDDVGPWADADTIQEGVDMASDGDTVLVYAGNYTEHVNVTRAVSIVGDGPNSTVRGNHSIPIFDVLADGVTIASLAIEAAGDQVAVRISGHDLLLLHECALSAEGGAAVLATDAEGVAVTNCTIDAVTAVRVDGGSGVTASGTEITGDILIFSSWAPTFAHCNVTGGVAIVSSAGVVIGDCVIEGSAANGTLLLDSPGSRIDRTTVASAAASGIALVGSDGVAIENVTASDNGDDGIAIRNSSGVLVSAALVEGNGRAGVALRGRSFGCTVRRSTLGDNRDQGARASTSGRLEGDGENHIHHNAFLGTLLNITQQAYDDGEGVRWHLRREGNHWSDHPKLDETGDGIADTPYEVAGGEAEDGYPLVSESDILNDAPAAVILSVSPQKGYLDSTVAFEGNGTDGDGAVRVLDWTSSIDGPLYRGTSTAFQVTGFGPGNHTVSLAVKDDEGAWSPAFTTWLRIEDRTTPVEPPVAAIIYAGPNLTMRGETVTFRGAGETEGNITRYRWGSDLDGPLYAGPSSTFATDDLSNGTHEISLAVRDDVDRWSGEVSTLVTVNGAPVLLWAEAGPDPAADDEPLALECDVLDDGEIVRYLWTSSLAGEIYNGSGATWTIGSLPPGDHLISVRAMDDLGAWTGEIAVRLEVNARPAVAISFPEDGMRLSGIVVMHGTAADADGDGLAVEVAVDGAWQDVQPGVWNLTLDTRTLGNGEHVVAVRAWDGTHWSGEASVTVTVDNRRARGSTRPIIALPEDFPTWLGLAAAILGLGAFLISGIGTYFLLSALLPLYSKLKEEGIADQHTRGRMIEYLRHNPGAHYNQIRKDLALPNGSAVYHLRVLEESGYVKSRTDGFYRRFYPYGYRVPDFALDGAERAIAGVVTAEPGISQKALAERLGLARSTVSHHVKRLRRKGAVTSSRGEGLRLTPECVEALRIQEGRDVIEGELLRPPGNT